MALELFPFLHFNTHPFLPKAPDVITFSYDKKYPHLTSLQSADRSHFEFFKAKFPN